MRTSPESPRTEVGVSVRFGARCQTPRANQSPNPYGTTLVSTSGLTSAEVVWVFSPSSSPELVAAFKSDNPKARNCHVTFVTTYGVKRNKHSGIVQSEVTLDDLFRA